MADNEQLHTDQGFIIPTLQPTNECVGCKREVVSDSGLQNRILDLLKTINGCEVTMSFRAPYTLDPAVINNDKPSWEPNGNDSPFHLRYYVYQIVCNSIPGRNILNFFYHNQLSHDLKPVEFGMNIEGAPVPAKDANGNWGIYQPKIIGPMLEDLKYIIFLHAPQRFLVEYLESVQRMLSWDSLYERSQKHDEQMAGILNKATELCKENNEKELDKMKQMGIDDEYINIWKKRMDAVKGFTLPADPSVASTETLPAEIKDKSEGKSEDKGEGKGESKKVSFAEWVEGSSSGSTPIPLSGIPSSDIAVVNESPAKIELGRRKSKGKHKHSKSKSSKSEKSEKVDKSEKTEKMDKRSRSSKERVGTDVATMITAITQINPEDEKDVTSDIENVAAGAVATASAIGSIL